MRLEIHGGPFDGGAVDVPRRTAPGLRLSLTSGEVTAFYRIVGTHGAACEVVFEELAVAERAADGAAVSARTSIP